ncbi:MAG: DUF2399 domain-containing protein [Treponema sp.]|nr:DUF2399 domain-containing protein [Treponema sp.]
MTGWEKKITDALIDHYYSSVPVNKDDRSVLRLRSSIFFPEFESVNSDEKISYLEAAESLEKKGIVKLNWVKWNRGERIKTITCVNIEKLFEESGVPFPKLQAQKIRTLFGEKAKALIESAANTPVKPQTDNGRKSIALLEFFSLNFGPRDIGQGIDRRAAEELIRLLEFACEQDRFEKITARALSILLYRDSKRLENLLAICKPLLSKAAKYISIPDLSFLERSYPETMISGEIIINYKGGRTSLVNSGGHILGIPLENAEEIESIQPISDKKENIELSGRTLLTIENKETFYALGSPHRHGDNSALSRFNCFLYIGGYSNRAAASLIKTLAGSGFTFYHAGDLDPDGILILQQILEIANTVRPGITVAPLRMDATAFDQYRQWARPLTGPMMAQLKKIDETTMAIPGVPELIQRIEETGLGVEQEIVDYR